jgi:glycerophosphoryl diester phosphodiesterase
MKIPKRSRIAFLLLVPVPLILFPLFPDSHIAHTLRNVVRNEYELFKVGRQRKEIVMGSTTLSNPSRLVVHAGGEYGGQIVCNCKEALDLSVAQGLEYIELDFNWTTDRQLVAVHDWTETIERLFGIKPRRLSLSEFEQLEMVNGATQLSLSTIMAWLQINESVFIITDVKENNLEALEFISEFYPRLITRIIPQIYHFSEYPFVSGLGYQNIILTLYRSSYTDGQLIRFVKKFPIFAITMPDAERARGKLPSTLEAMGVRSYVHTVNDKERALWLLRNRVHGVYSDNRSLERFLKSQTASDYH